MSENLLIKPLDSDFSQLFTTRPTWVYIKDCFTSSTSLIETSETSLDVVFQGCKVLWYIAWPYSFNLHMTVTSTEIRLTQLPCVGRFVKKAPGGPCALWGNKASVSSRFYCYLCLRVNVPPSFAFRTRLGIFYPLNYNKGHLVHTFLPLKCWLECPDQ